MGNTPVNITINGKQIVTSANKTILNAARDNGIDIPALCYEPRLEPHRSCLVCSVEDKKTGRILMSCAVPAADGMEIETDSPAALDARKSALELLLSTHYADCRGPCNTTCPATVDIQGYLALANAGKYREALELIRETNPMPLVCGRVCVKYCEANCRRNYVDTPATINFVKRYVADLEYDRLERPALPPRNGKKVAVIGGGPSGLTCAYFLARKGYEVTIFEAQPKLGGMVRYGIPDYRMPANVLDKEVDYIISHGINVETNVKVGRDITLDDLKARGYDATYIAVGAWNGKPMGIEGEDSPHVQIGVRFLEGVKKAGAPKLEGRVVVVGGGNTAIDVSRTAVRCGASKVTILYRRTLDEMPADKEEIHDAVEEGIELRLLTAPKRVVAENGKLTGIECIEMYLGEPDASGRRKPLPKKDSEFIFECDHIIAAIGQDSDLSLLKNEKWGEIKTRRGTTIEVDPETMSTNIPGVFSGGDVATGPKAAIDAIGAGRKAAIVIDKWLSTGRIVKLHDEFLSSKAALTELDRAAFEHVARIERARMHKVEPEARIKTFEEVDLGITAAEAASEASRCLTCGCKTVYDCDLKDYATEAGASQKAFRGRFRKYEPDARHQYVALDPNKCILCGRCVRYCGELIGIHALGFIGRGADTVVKPALDRPLSGTPCIACGNCIEVCPTGAIEFNYPFKRQAPFRTKSLRTICADCGVGCEVDINSLDRDIFYITAKPYDAHIEGELCRKGRFESTYIPAPGRIGRCVENGKGPLTLDEASRRIVDRLGTIRAKHGGEAMLFLSSPSATMEETFLFATLAKHFGSSRICSTEDLLHGDIPYIKAFAGLTLSSLKQSDVARADVVINIGPGLTTHAPVFGFQVKRAVSRGAALIQIGAIDDELTRYVTHHVECRAGSEGQAIRGILKRVMTAEGYDMKPECGVDGFETFKARILKSKFGAKSPAVASAASLLTDPLKNVAVIFNAAGPGAPFPSLGDTLNLVLLTCRLQGFGDGLVITQSACNSQGSRDVLYDNPFAFVTSDSLKAAREALKAGDIKAIVSLNEDVDLSGLVGDDILEGIEIVAALSHFETSLSQSAGVVIPYAPLIESEGTVVSFDGRARKFGRIFEPAPGFTPFEALNRLLHQASGKSYSLDYVRELIAGKLPQYEPLAAADVDDFYLIDAARRKGLFGKKVRFAH